MSQKLSKADRRREEGFTLIEVLAVMVIIGILAAIAIPAFFNQRNKASDSGAKEMAHTSRIAIETLGSDNDGSYSTASPTALNAVDRSIPTAAGSPSKPYVSAASGTADSWTLDDHGVDRRHLHGRQELLRGHRLHLHSSRRQRPRRLPERRELGLAAHGRLVRTAIDIKSSVWARAASVPMHGTSVYRCNRRS